MHRKEAIFGSPLRLLDRSLRGGLGKGNLGAVLAPAGVGKSAFLVQVGLDHLLRDRAVLHVAIGQTVEHVSAWYDALFEDLARLVALANPGAVRESIAHRRLIRAFADAAAFGPERLDEALAAFETHLQQRPWAILVDAFDWRAPGCTAALEAMKASARGAGAELWMSVRTPGGAGAGAGPSIVAPPCEGCAALVDVALVLEPHGGRVKVRLVKDLDGPCDQDVHLWLDSDTLRLVTEVAPALPAAGGGGSFTLLGTGSAGAEAEFGACAERFGIAEVNFTFAGRGDVARTRGLVELGEEALELGSVSSAYLKAHMHRSYPDTPAFRRVLQAIWHQVSGAAEVFSVGAILPDGTVHGGTGWAVELARHWNKPVHVFDQERQRWFRWDGAAWVEESPPTVTGERFAGAGTRSLSDAGREAIRALFERSFGER